MSGTIMRILGQLSRLNRRGSGDIPPAGADRSLRVSHPIGHFYSPIVDPITLRDKLELIWPERPAEISGIDFSDDNHVEVLSEWFPRHIASYDYPEESSSHGETEFYTQNSQFSWLDARALFVFLLEVKPRKVIEIGSGYSSLLTADVNRRFLDRSISFCCIEPFPREFLKAGVDGVTELIETEVQHVDLAVFDALSSGDVLFIDSSHVSKTGSDVNFLFFEVVPRLRPGVFVHVHDIFLPFDYPKDWVLEENRSWNEQYLLRALLMDSSRLEVVFGCSYAFFAHKDLVIRALNLPGKVGFGGGSIWLRVKHC